MPKLLRWISLLLIYCTLFGTEAFAKDILLAYQETQKPYSLYYADVIRGIQDTLKRSGYGIDRFLIDFNTSPASILPLLKPEYDGLILLGGAGLQLAPALLRQTDISIVTGISYPSPEAYPEVTGVSMLTSPEQLLRFIKRLHPARRLHHVADTRFHHGYQKMLAKISKRLGFTLAVHPVNDISETWDVFNALIPSLDGKQDILFLSPYRAVVPDLYTMSRIVMACWTRKIPLLSSSYTHAQYGAMASIYPAPRSHGEQIAHLLLEQITHHNQWKPRIELSKHSWISLNLRFAKHLGIEPPPETLKHVDRITGY